MTEQWLWGDGSELLWGDGTTMGEDGFSSLSTGTTWNPADIGSNITLSNGDLTATKTTDALHRSGRATTSKTANRRYFEVTINGMSVDFNLAAVAVAESTADLLTYFGRLTNSIAYYGDGSVYQNDVVIATLAAYTVGQTVGCALDEDAGKGWFCDGSGSYGTGDPAAGTNPHFTFTPGTAYFPGFTLHDNSPADIVTGNFGATAFVHAVPAGFEAWDFVEPEPEPEAEEPAVTYGGGHDDLTLQVRAKWELIESIQAENREREAAERERKAEIEARQPRLAELEAERGRKRRKAAQQARDAERQAILAEIADAERQASQLLQAIETAREEIVRLMNEVAAAELMRRRRAAGLALLLASEM